jgi:release factor glutamine methyltransferase
MEISYNGLSLSVPDSIYEPAEDSFMLASAAEGLKGSVLEIGCGSGVVSLACARNGASVWGVDINPEAVRCARENAERNSIKDVRFMAGDLFASLPEQQFDAILFNPPYLPTTKNERLASSLNSAFDGGEDGRKVLDRFLDQFQSFLKPGGALFLVQSSLNGEEKTRAKLASMGYSVAVVAAQSFFFERLLLIKASKP